MKPSPIKPPTQPEVAPKIAPAKSPEFTFRFRQHISGNFPGLWELSRMYLNSPGFEVLIDADNLSACLDAVSSIFEEGGH